MLNFLKSCVGRLCISVGANPLEFAECVYASCNFRQHVFFFFYIYSFLAKTSQISRFINKRRRKNIKEFLINPLFRELLSNEDKKIK